MSRIWINDPARELTAENLIELAYPTGSGDLPTSSGYHYSNTNYTLAGMIAAKATGQSYRDLVHHMIIEAFGLHSTYYESGTYPDAVTDRLAHGYFDNPACADYQAKCTQSWNHALMGRDVRGMSTSWAQAAGGAIADARDVDRWMRAVSAGHVVPPKQQAEWMALVSIKTGEPIADVTADDPARILARSWQGCSRIDRLALVLPGRDTRLPNALCVVRKGESCDYAADQLATGGRGGQAPRARRRDLFHRSR
jgi:D-alanyl-D-alanine carboxypeptidase